MICCANGHGRSAAVAVALLLSMNIYSSVHDAILFIQQKRPTVALAAIQRRFLEQYCSREYTP
tara:strand:- start:1337 stop:1525 length:189 start_codon:yes stop_codon:yes gene_type:complete